MPEPDETSRGAFDRLDQKLDRFEASRRTKPFSIGIGDAGSGGFSMLGQMLGGVLGGLGLGWLVDHFAGTSPFGLLIGLMVGLVVSLVMVVRTALAMSARNDKAGMPSAAPDADDDDD
ncbi:MAG TPA: AtpZ/AtpI family protein [Caulobacteraceae bacterium]|nr:AtpZ/AtpI family protein [Caulobacteraceae bacterium]